MEDSERWRAVGRIEAEQSITDVSLFFGVHHSKTSRLWKQFQTPQTVVRRPVGRHPRWYWARTRDKASHDPIPTPLGYRGHTIVAKRNRRVTSTASIGKAISAATVRRRLHMNGQYVRVPRVCVPISVQSRRARLKRCRENGYRTDLHIFKRGFVTAVRYRDEVLEPIVRLYAAAVDSTFVLMDDDARPHRADIVDDYLDNEGIAHMAWPAYSPDLNPIENLLDALGRAVSSRFPPPATLIELEKALQEEWRWLNSAVVDHLIESMVRRYFSDSYYVWPYGPSDNGLELVVGFVESRVRVLLLLKTYFVKKPIYVKYVKAQCSSVDVVVRRGSYRRASLDRNSTLRGSSTIALCCFIAYVNKFTSNG
ncbi:transposable element Tcb1 transposase [Trichonephila clavipes]|nr:transposable element Tcb1 transposase [Trichonephila clavipes]